MIINNYLTCINVSIHFSICLYNITYNYKNTPAWYKENLTKLSDIEGYDNTNKLEAYRILEEYNDLVTGVIYKNTNKKHYEDTLKNYKRDEPIAHQDLTFDEEMFNSLCDEFR